MCIPICSDIFIRHSIVLPHEEKNKREDKGKGKGTEKEKKDGNIPQPMFDNASVTTLGNQAVQSDDQPTAKSCSLEQDHQVGSLCLMGVVGQVRRAGQQGMLYGSRQVHSAPAGHPAASAVWRT